MDQNPVAPSSDPVTVPGNHQAPVDQSHRMRCTFESLRELDRITAVFEGRIMERCELIARQESKRLIDDRIIVQAVADVMTQLSTELRTSISEQSSQGE